MDDPKQVAAFRKAVRELGGDRIWGAISGSPAQGRQAQAAASNAQKKKARVAHNNRYRRDVVEKSGNTRFVGAYRRMIIRIFTAR